MDRKQAVTILKRKTTIPGDGYTWEQINEAIDMAIAALSPPNEPLTIEQLRAELEQVKRERDAAIRDIKCPLVCARCRRPCDGDETCIDNGYMYFEWVGVCEEN